MKKIKIAKTNKYVLVDDLDFEHVSKFKWHLDSKNPKRGYAVRNGIDGKKLYMHREIMKVIVGQMVDHKNGNKLDNQKANLRICSIRENLSNRGCPSNNSTGLKGVSFRKERGKWTSKIASNGKRYSLGCFDSPIDAARAYNEAAKKYHGEFAFQNVL